MRHAGRGFRRHAASPPGHNNKFSTEVGSGIFTDIMRESASAGWFTDREVCSGIAVGHDTGRYYIQNNGELTALNPDDGTRHKVLPFSSRLSVWHGNRKLKGISDFILKTDTEEIFIITDSPLGIGEKATIGFDMPFNKTYLGGFEVEVTGNCICRGNCPDGMFAVFIDCPARKILELEDFLELKGQNINLVV